VSAPAEARTRSRSQLANDAWEALLTAHAALMKRFAAEEVWRELSMREYDVLYTLSKCSGPLRLSELNRHVLLSQPALSRMIERLVERGLIARTTDPADGRGVLLSLTDAGRSRQRGVGGRHGVSVARTVSAALDPDELSQLETLCRKLAVSQGAYSPGDSTS
jgi:DNA-binding MarR family transcriptional regulator